MRNERQQWLSGGYFNRALFIQGNVYEAQGASQDDKIKVERSFTEHNTIFCFAFMNYVTETILLVRLDPSWE